MEDEVLEDVVIGSYVAAIEYKKKMLYLIPSAQEEAKQIRAVLSEKGLAILISPSDSVDYILDTLEYVP